MIPHRVEGFKTFSASRTRVSGPNHVFCLHMVPHVGTVHAGELTNSALPDTLDIPVHELFPTCRNNNHLFYYKSIKMS